MQTLRPVRLALLLVLMSLTNLPAQSVREETSLRFVPASASLYSANLRNGEQFQKFVKSRAFAKLKSLPLVQMGLGQLRAKWEANDDLDKFRELLKQPENQQLLKLLLDGLSHEVFVYGDTRVGKWIGTITRMGNRLNLAQMRATQQGIDSGEAVARAVVKILQDDPELLRAPGGVIGFRVSDPKVAIAQLARLETLVTQLIENGKPEFKDRFTRQQIGDASYLTFKLDGTMVPWDQLLDEADLDAEDQEKLAAQLRKVKFTISLGVYEDYLLLSTGEDDAQLRAIGQGSLLVDHPRMQPLAAHFDKPVLSIGYVSKEFVQQLSAVDEQLDQMTEMVRTVMPMVPLGEDVKDDLMQDVELFAKQAAALQPRQGAVAGVSFEADGGYESITYNWTENRSLDDSKPLTILNHVGADPIAFYASRRKAVPAEREFVRLWATKLGQYFDRIAVPFMGSDQQELYAEVKQRALPLLARLAVANQTQLQPALADGQTAIVLDAPVSDAQWHERMPAADDEVPMPQIACVWSVSDADLLKAGAAEYFDVLQAAIVTMSEVMPDQIPPIDIPKPESRESDTGTVYYYALPPMAGAHKSIAPNVGLSADTMVMSLFPKTTMQLLKSHSISTTGPMARVADRSLGSAWQFKMNRFVQMVRPWVKYGFQLAEQEGESNPMIESHVSAVMDVLECIRTINGVTYGDDGAVVSHTRSEFKDLD